LSNEPQKDVLKIRPQGSSDKIKKELIDIAHAHDVLVSTGGFIE
jgi:hypothetical protein